MKKFLWFLPLVLLAGGVQAQQNSATFVSGTFSSTGVSTPIAPALTGLNRHLIQIEACTTNTQNVYLCFGTGNNCNANTAAYELAAGQMAPPLTVGMYTGITGQQLSGSVMFNADIAFAPVTGTQCVHALLD